MKSIGESIYEQGLAICSIDISSGIFHFRYRDERFDLKRMALDNGRPNRMVRTFYLPEMKYGMVARIEEVRQAAALESGGYGVEQDVRR